MAEKWHSGSEEYTWDHLIAAIGQDFGGPEQVAGDVIEPGQIRRFCEVLEFDCPLHHDDAIARKHGYPSIIAPYTSVQAPFSLADAWKSGARSRFPTTDPDTFSRSTTRSAPPDIPMPPTAAYFVTGIETEYFAPAIVGDRLTTRGRKLLSANVKDTAIGSGAFVTTEQSLFNQNGMLIAQQRTTGYHFNPRPSHLSEQAPERHQGPNENESPYMQTEGLIEEVRVDWSIQRYFEDIREGNNVPPVPLNLTFQRLIEWASATQLFPPPHHNPRYARHYGAPDIYANNVTVQTWWERTVREFIGLDGQIKRIGPFRIRTFAIPGDQVVTKGTVQRKWQEGGENFVELEIWSEHARGVSVGPAPVIVTVPSR